MKYLVFGAGSKSALAVHNILVEFFTYFVKKTDNEVVLFGYDDKEQRTTIVDRLNYVSIKNPFFGCPLNKYRLARKFNSVFHLDSGILSWDYVYRHATKLFSSEQFDCVIAAAGNFFYTQAAYKFAKENNLKLVLMYFDPFTNNLGTCNKKKRLIIEKEWYNYTSKILYDIDGSGLPFEDTDNKAESFYIPIFEKESKYNQNGHIIYGGTIYSSFRGADQLEQFLDDNKDSGETFDLYIDKAKVESINKNVYRFNFVNRDEYLEISRQSKAIIVLGNGEQSTHIPSKILAAISLKKPIIGFNINEKIDQIAKYPFYFSGCDKEALKKINNLKKNDFDKFEIYETFPERNPELLLKILTK